MFSSSALVILPVGRRLALLRDRRLDKVDDTRAASMNLFNVILHLEIFWGLHLALGYYRLFPNIAEGGVDTRIYRGPTIWLHCAFVVDRVQAGT